MSTPKDRIFLVQPAPQGDERWFFKAREGVLGPFPSYGDAAYALINYYKFCIEFGVNGGRRGDAQLEELMLGWPNG